MKLSANLGFLWTELPLLDAVRAAKAADFDAVEFHWPYAVPAADLRAVLTETGLPVMGINTPRGNVVGGENGLSALPGRGAEARAAVDAAMDYAAAIGAKAVHVMAGFSSGPRAHAAFCETLAYASDRGAALGITAVIEPLNPYDAPGYFLSTTVQAAAIIRELARPNVRLMFDAYHVQVTEGDVSRRFETLMPLIGHVQFAGAPSRGRPDEGELNLSHVLARVKGLGWDSPAGAEYKPGGPTGDTLSWMPAFRAI